MNFTGVPSFLKRWLRRSITLISREWESASSLEDADSLAFLRLPGAGHGTG